MGNTAQIRSKWMHFKCKHMHTHIHTLLPTLAFTIICTCIHTHPRMYAHTALSSNWEWCTVSPSVFISTFFRDWSCSMAGICSGIWGHSEHHWRTHICPENYGIWGSSDSLLTIVHYVDPKRIRYTTKWCAKGPQFAMQIESLGRQLYSTDNCPQTCEGFSLKSKVMFCINVLPYFCHKIVVL